MDSLATLIQLALTEDIGPGDVTTQALFGDKAYPARAEVYAKQDLVVSGVQVATRTFTTLNAALNCDILVHEGARLQRGDHVLHIRGELKDLLQAERVALNFLQHLCGIATWTAKFVTAVEGTGVKIRDTRKTLPGYRNLEKQATQAGGAENHRIGLYDQFLIKNNHIDLVGSVTAAVQRAKSLGRPDLKLQVEVRTPNEAAEAVASGAQGLLLDNMDFATAEQLVQHYRQHIELEVSGNVTLANVARWAQTGVHAISIGALTHSAPAADLAMKITKI